MHYDRIAACPVSVPPQSLKSKQESKSAFSGTSAMKAAAQERLGKLRRKGCKANAEPNLRSTCNIEMRE